MNVHHRKEESPPQGEVSDHFQVLTAEPKRAENGMALMLFVGLTVLIAIWWTSSYYQTVDSTGKGLSTYKDGNGRGSGLDDSPSLYWWQKTIIYQIYPRSFQDSDGDGIGDLRGIKSRLDHFEYINVNTIWLSPIYESPMVDFGYDVSNHTAIEPIFGSMKDFEDLLEEIHTRGMHLIMDFIPNHTSDKHKWFTESKKSNSPDNAYREYYVWHDGKRDENGNVIPPNNWGFCVRQDDLLVHAKAGDIIGFTEKVNFNSVARPVIKFLGIPFAEPPLSFFGGSAWEWVASRNQFYLHQFAKEQPDLNARNPAVLRELQNILHFWLDKGVDGFRVDAILTLFEDPLFRDEPRSYDPLAKRPEQHEYLKHIYTNHLDEVHEVVRSWKQLLDLYESRDWTPRLLITEAYADCVHKIVKYYNSCSMPFNFDLVFLDFNCDGMCFRHWINNFLVNVPQGKWPNFVLGNHDRPRVAARFGGRLVDVMNMLLLLLPGTPTTYYGEEIGMEHVNISFEDTQDPCGKFFGKDEYYKWSRDPVRSPMQWTRQKGAGFSTADRTWLPIHPNFKEINIEVQKDTPGSTHLKIYRFLAHLRQDKQFMNENLSYSVINKNIFSFIRHSGSDPGFLVALNVGNNVSSDKYSLTLAGSSNGEVILDTEEWPSSNTFISLDNVTIKPGQGLVIKVLRD